MSEIRDERHWTEENFRQRMTKREWMNVLVEKLDQVIFHGRTRKLKAKKIGFGIVEVYKK